MHGATIKIKIHEANFYRGGDVKVSLIWLSYTAWMGFKIGRARGYHINLYSYVTVFENKNHLDVSDFVFRSEMKCDF
jgi:hypothetical protein